MKKRQKILIIDEELPDVISFKSQLKYHFDIRTVKSETEVFKTFEEFLPDLVLISSEITGMENYELCRKLKRGSFLKKIPFIFVMDKNKKYDVSLGFKSGAVDFIYRDDNPELVLSRILNHIELNNQRENFESEVRIRTSELLEIQRATIYMLGEAGHYNDNDTGVHIWRMAEYAGLIAEEAGFTRDKIRNLKLAAPMHDTGKIGIPDTILKKNAPLSVEEWKIMKTHTVIGHNILLKSTSELFLTAADIALYHHEKWDGTGYPVGLKNDQIPFSARVVAIADVFDALTMERPYKEAWTIERSVNEISKMDGIFFDPELVEAFKSSLDIIIQTKKEWDEKEEITKNKFMFPLHEIN